jgi:outer membrane protein assembly factor BamD
VEASAAYEEFRKLHPLNEKAAYALYRLSLSNYHQIIGIDTEQTPVKNAVSAMEKFLVQYPGSEYVPEIRNGQCHGEVSGAVPRLGVRARDQETAGGLPDKAARV